MRVNTNTLSQPALCYHCLRRDVGGCKECVMKWEERAQRHQQRQVQGRWAGIFVKWAKSFQVKTILSYKKAFENLYIGANKQEHTQVLLFRCFFLEKPDQLFSNIPTSVLWVAWLVFPLSDLVLMFLWPLCSFLCLLVFPRQLLSVNSMRRPFLNANAKMKYFSLGRLVAHFSAAPEICLVTFDMKSPLDSVSIYRWMNEIQVHRKQHNADAKLLVCVSYTRQKSWIWLTKLSFCMLCSMLHEQCSRNPNDVISSHEEADTHSLVLIR